MAISIHAPVKGATTSGPSNTKSSNDFNPRTREGCDGVFKVDAAEIRLFQSTHP